MDSNKNNRQCINKYETLVNEKYKEQVDAAGKSEDATDAILKEYDEDIDSTSSVNSDFIKLHCWFVI